MLKKSSRPKMNKTKKLFLLQSKDLVKLAISFSTNFLWNLSKKVWIPPRFFFNNKQSNKKLLIIIDKQPENHSKIKITLKISFPDKRKRQKTRKILIFFQLNILYYVNWNHFWSEVSYISRSGWSFRLLRLATIHLQKSSYCILRINL